MSTRIVAPLPLQAGRVSLRVLRVSDAGRLQQLLRDNRSWLQRWEATHPGGQSAEPGSVPLRSSIRALRRGMREGRGVPFGVCYDDELVGQLSISDIARGAVQSAQIGYWISETHAGRGIIPTAVALAIDCAFMQLGLHRIEICLRPENDASRRVVEKLELRYEGRRLRYIYIDGAWRDHDCYAVVRGERPAGMLAALAREQTQLPG